MPNSNLPGCPQTLMDELAPPPSTPEEQAQEDAFVERMMAKLGLLQPQPEPEVQVREVSRSTRQLVLDSIRAQLLELAASRLAQEPLQARGVLEMLANQLDSLAAEPIPTRPFGMLMPPRPQGRCRSDSDGDCSWIGCPQIRDGEPAKSGRACPLLAEHAATVAHQPKYIRPEERAEAILKGADESQLSNLLHQLWTKAVGTQDYVKGEWQALEIVLYRMWRQIHEQVAL